MRDGAIADGLDVGWLCGILRMMSGCGEVGERRISENRSVLSLGTLRSRSQEERWDLDRKGKESGSQARVNAGRWDSEAEFSCAA